MNEVNSVASGFTIALMNLAWTVE